MYIPFMYISNVIFFTSELPDTRSRFSIHFEYSLVHLTDEQHVVKLYLYKISYILLNYHWLHFI